MLHPSKTAADALRTMRAHVGAHVMSMLSASLVAAFALALPATANDADLGIDDVDALAGMRQRWLGAMDSLHIPGAAIAVIRDGELVALEGLGVRDVDGSAVGPDTMFYIASITKTYVATAVASLASQGELDLDSPVVETLPRFKLANADATASITIRNLLCHRAGINVGPIVVLDAYTGEITEDRYYHWLATAEPSGETNYTNVNFTLAGRVLEAKSGMPWQEHLQRKLFDPLGLTRTTAYASRLYGDDDHAAPLEPDGDGFRRCVTRKSDSTMHAAGGLGTSARDGARWILAGLDDGALVSKGLVNDDMLRDMRARHGELEPDGQIRRMDGYGLGWRHGTFRGRPYLVHGGGYVGTSTHMSFLPEQGHGVVVLTNVSHGGALCDVVSMDVYEHLLGETGHRDLLPAYEDRVVSRLARLASTADEPLGPLTDEHVTRPLDGHVGAFVNEHWGTLSIRREADGLLARLGRLEMAFEHVSADRFFVRGSGIDFEGLFMPGETVDTVVLTDDETLIRFERGDVAR